MDRLRGPLFWIVPLSAILVMGCGKQEKLYDMSGTITFEGKAIPSGTVFFDPDGSQGVEGQGGFAAIHDGHFNTAEGGRGVRGGAYDVRVLAFDGKKANEAPSGKALFPQYTMKRDLPKENSILEIDVPAEARAPQRSGD